jgi:hypothetical protein
MNSCASRSDCGAQIKRHATQNHAPDEKVVVVKTAQSA